MRRFLKKFRYYGRFSRAFFGKHQKILLLSCFLTLLVFFLLPRFFSFLGKGKTTRFGLVGRYTLNQLPNEVQEKIGDGLTKITAEGKIVPSLAENWEVKKNGRIFLFRLKDGLFWQDGTPVKADQIEYFFTDVTTTVLDEKTLQFELKEAFSPFPSILTQPIFKKGLVGTGDYRVEKVSLNGQIVEKIILNNIRQKNQPSLVFRFYPTQKAVLTAFKLGEVDQLVDINQLDELKDWPNSEQKVRVAYDHYVAIFFNTDKPSLSDKTVRQGLAYAVKKRWEPRALGPLNPHSWAYNPQLKKYEYDLEKTWQLLEKNEETQTPPLEKIDLATTPALLSVAEVIKKEWESLGLNVKVKVISSLSEDYDALLITQKIPPDPDLYVFWHSTQTNKANLSHYKSPKLDKLLEDGRKTFDQEERRQIYLDFQKALVEDTPAVFLYHPTLYTLTRM